MRPLTPFMAPPGGAPLRPVVRPEAAPSLPQDSVHVAAAEPSPVPTESLTHLAGASGMATLAAFGTLFAVAHNASAGQVFPAPQPAPDSISRTVPAPAPPVAQPPMAAAQTPDLPLMARVFLTPETFMQPLPDAPAPPRVAADPTNWLLAGDLQPAQAAPEVQPPPARPAAIPVAKGDYVKHGINFSHLITDAEFVNANAMSVDEVQAFFEHQESGLAKFTEGGRSAAQIVVDAAQEHQVNPLVIVTTLEKEVGLVSHGAVPSGWRSRSAMGYAYTDSGNRPRGSTFTWQVDKGTELMRELFDEAAGTSFPKEKSVDYGARTIKIRNAATWALMRYTPHTVDTQLRQTGGGNYNFRKIFERYHGERLELFQQSLTNV